MRPIALLVVSLLTYDEELTSTDTSRLPVAVIGAGPVESAAAAHLAVRDIPLLILESGDRVGAALLDRGHVARFSPWRWVVDGAARRMLDLTRVPHGHVPWVTDAAAVARPIHDWLASSLPHRRVESFRGDGSQRHGSRCGRDFGP